MSCRHLPSCLHTKLAWSYSLAKDCTGASEWHIALLEIYSYLLDRRQGKVWWGQRKKCEDRVKSSVPDWPLSRVTQLWALGLLSCPIMRTDPIKFRSVCAWCLLVAEETQCREADHPEERLSTPCTQSVHCKEMEGKSLFLDKGHSSK